MARLKLPKRIAQKKSEAASFAIVNYKLGKLGIFRSQTENDYGIDVDLELVDDGEVTGRSVKIQVKSSENLKLRKDGTPSIGGIKQSTLNYWCQTAFRTSVIAYAVDLATEKIYVTADLFWQATRLLDGGTSTKSISFLPEGPDNLALAEIVTVIHAFQPTISELVAAHKLALRRLKSFLGLLGDAYHYDAGSQLHEPDVFHDLIEVCRVLLWDQGDELWKDKRDRRGWQSVDYWIAKSEADGWDGLSYLASQPILAVLVPALVRHLRRLEARVIAGKFFWAHQDPAFLALVHETTIPDVDGRDALIDWGNHYDKRSTVVNGMGAYFAQQARIPPVRAGRSRSQARP